MNTLYYGDNLKILRDYIKDESVDLVYLDPPFNSNRNCGGAFDCRCARLRLSFSHCEARDERKGWERKS